jgi:uncharacterized membrane protein
MTLTAPPRKRSALRPATLVLALTGLAAFARFAGLGHQSFWYDEALTVYLIEPSFGDMLSQVRAQEATPHLYFALAWVWTRVFGDGEVGLRSLSALAGVLTVPVTFAAARSLVSERAGVIAAALVAVSPPLIWFSQEARSYSLLVLMCAVSLMFFAWAWREPGRRRNLVGWAIASFLAVATHYFALFVVVPEALWLLVASRQRRPVVLATGGLALACAALVPLVLYQRTHGGADWIAQTELFYRLKRAASLFVTGVQWSDWRAVVVVSTLVVAAAVVLVLRRGSDREREGALVAIGLLAAALAIPLAGALAGSDYVIGRNLLPAWVPLAIVVAAGLGAARTRFAGPAAAVAVCAALAAFSTHLAATDRVQRDNWRGVAEELGPAAEDRVLVVTPGWQSKPLRLYERRVEPLRTSVRVREVDTVVYRGTLPRDGAAQPVEPPPPFRRESSVTVHRMTVTRYLAPRPVELPATLLRTPGPNGAGPWLQRGG